MRKLDRSGRQIELALGVLGRGPEDIARARYSTGCATPGTPGTRSKWAPGRSELRQPLLGRAARAPDHPETMRQQLDDRGWHRMDHRAPAGSPTTSGQGGALRRPRASPGGSAAVIAQHGGRRRLRALRGDLRLYTELLVELCEERGIRLVFAFLPGLSATEAHVPVPAGVLRVPRRAVPARLFRALAGRKLPGRGSPHRRAGRASSPPSWRATWSTTRAPNEPNAPTPASWPWPSPWRSCPTPGWWRASTT